MCGWSAFDGRCACDGLLVPAEDLLALLSEEEGSTESGELVGAGEEEAEGGGGGHYGWVWRLGWLWSAAEVCQEILRRGEERRGDVEVGWWTESCLRCWELLGIAHNSAVRGGR